MPDPAGRSTKVVEIGVGRRMAEDAADGDDLALVMKGMGQHVMQHQRRGAHGDVAIGKMKFGIGVELLIGQGREVGVRPLADLLLQDPGIGYGGAFFRIPIDVRLPLEGTDPESFAVEDVDHLFAQSAEAEAGHLLPIVAGGDCGEVVEHEIEAGVGPTMQLANTVDCEH